MASSLDRTLAAAGWEEIAHAIQRFDPGVEPTSARARRLRTRTGLLKIAISHKLSRLNGDNVIDMSFFMSSQKAVRNLEKEYELIGIRKSEFVALLKVLLEKLKKQKLKVKKIGEMRDNFTRMKGVVENGHSPL